MDALDDVPVDSERDTELDRAFELWLKLVDLRRADEIMPLGPGAVYTASVVLWLLVYQRLKRSATLQTACQTSGGFGVRVVRGQQTPSPANVVVGDGNVQRCAAAAHPGSHGVVCE